MSGMWSCRWASQLVGSHHETASLSVQWTLESLLTLNLVPVTNLQYACTKTMSNCSRFPEQPPTRSPWVTLPDVSSHRNLRLYSLITKKDSTGWRRLQMSFQGSKINTLFDGETWRDLHGWRKVQLTLAASVLVLICQAHQSALGCKWQDCVCRFHKQWH